MNMLKNTRQSIIFDEHLQFKSLTTPWLSLELIFILNENDGPL